MTSLFPLEHVLCTRQALRDVRLLRDNDLRDTVAVELRFDPTVVYLVVNPDDDTISVTDVLDVPDETHWDSARGPWLTAIGKRVIWYWGMQNNRGYWDAVQIQLTRDEDRDGVKEPDVSFQAVAIASRLSIGEVKNVE